MDSQWMRDIDGALFNLDHVREFKVDTWAGDDYGVPEKPYISVVAVVTPDKHWHTLARGFESKDDAQTWLDANLSWLVTHE